MSRFVFAFLLVLVAACGGEPTPQTQQTPRPAQSSDWSALAPGWTSLPAPPYVAACAASVWTGRELVYWGGDDQCRDGTARNEGGAFDPSARGWRRLPPSPLGGRSSVGAVWTGEEVIVWGGWADGLRSDGAAYDATQDSWRRLPQAPIGPRVPVATAWSGREMLVWGSRERIGEIVTGAAYDPATDGWRDLPPAPFALNQAEAVWTGRELIVYGALLDGNNLSERPHARGLAYDPAADTWRELPPYPLSPQASTVVWTGEEMIAWDYELHAAAYDPAADAWRPLPDLPLDFSECYPKGVFVDRFVLAWHCGRPAILDLASGRWRKVADPSDPVVGDPVEADGVVLFAGAWPGAGNSFFAFKPGTAGVGLRLASG